jgi:Ca-activated chloride channel family protein
MHVSARLHHPQVALDPTPTHLVVSFTGDTSDSLRPPLGIIPVVDRSGSMAGSNKLGQVTAALSHLAGYLTDDDSVALVSFDDQVTTHLHPTQATQAGMATIRSALSELTPRGSTDLASGLAQGLVHARAMVAAQPLVQVRIILLTDGQTNTGVTDPAAIAALVADVDSRVSVSTLGVGLDCDHDLLGTIAEAGHGSYGFIETAAAAPGVLGAEIGGLLEVDAADVTLEVVVPSRYATIAAPLGVSSTLTASGYQVRLGNILAGATRHVVLPLLTKPPTRAHARPITLTDLTVTAQVNDAPFTLVLKPKLHFIADPAPRDYELDEPIDLATLAQAQREAELLAREGNYAAALAHLRAVRINTTTANMLLAAITAHYTDHANYTSSSSMRNSSSSLLRGSLVGSSQSFDALASRTVGSYTTAGQRDVAASTTMATSDVAVPPPVISPAPAPRAPQSQTASRLKLPAAQPPPPAPKGESDESAPEE